MRAETLDGMALARRGAVFLYSEGVSSVWVFGSVAKGRSLDFRSDIDLAVTGLDPLKFLRVGAQLEELLDFPVDLVEMERASAALRAQIEEHGILLASEN